MSKQLTPAAGKLLIAEPFLGDPNFERAVILLCEHTEQGTFGLVLTQPIENKLNLAPDREEELHFDLSQGGPVGEDTLHFIHRYGHIEGVVHVAEGIWWGGDLETIQDNLTIGLMHEEGIRFFMGYAGWGAGQLEEEIARDSWVLTDATAEFIFDTPPEKLWRAVLKSMGGSYKVLSNYPLDPKLN